MFYRPEAGHGLPHDPFRAIVSPRPIGWISSISNAGLVNLAPYSFFNALSGQPPLLMFSSEGIKDSITNAMETGEFVVNMATRPLAAQLNETSRAHAAGINEFDVTGLTPAPCEIVAAPRVAESPASLECKVTDIVPVKDLNGDVGDRVMAIAQVVGIHINEAFLRDGQFDNVAAQTIARCGYWEYQVSSEMFSMPRPDHQAPH
ncbi:flavin reductase family protein [Devosia alba]|uniref:flavin reductase family protein n=1 Tax=Devosia alba TaxID=3152360 RepID=UPI003266149B